MKLEVPKVVIELVSNVGPTNAEHKLNILQWKSTMMLMPRQRWQESGYYKAIICNCCVGPKTLQTLCNLIEQIKVGVALDWEFLTSKGVLRSRVTR